MNLRKAQLDHSFLAPAGATNLALQEPGDNSSK